MDEMNYETIIDTILPHEPRKPVDLPLYPEKKIDEKRLKDRYAEDLKKMIANNV